MPMLNYEQFSNGQSLSNLDSTGEVSTNQWDLEEIHGATMVDDQIVGGVKITILTAPAQATIAGTEGVVFEVRTAAAGALTSLYEIVGAISVLPAKIIAGAEFWVPIYANIAQAKLGVWYRAVSTSVVGAITLDADYLAEPVCKNEALQKKHT